MDLRPGRLSASSIWQSQRAYFAAQGPRAWASGAVPHYVTSNPFLARAFADVIAGFAADRAAAAPDGEPLYVVELGAGCGRLGYQIARALGALGETGALGRRTVYVLTDFAEATVAWWRGHPWLRPLFEAGLLDVARFDVERDDRLHLLESGRTITPERPAGDLAVVANYVFDSLPQDVFECRDGELREWHVEVAGAAIDPGGAGFTQLEPAWCAAPLHDPPYDDLDRCRLLERYRAGDGVFSFPHAGLDALERMRRLTRGALLVFAADKGAVEPADVHADGVPALTQHGSVSMTVNFDALGAWAATRDGVMLYPEHRGQAVEVCVLTAGAGPWPATIAAFERSIAQRTPDDLHALKSFLVAHATALSMRQLLAYVRLSGHDAKVVLDCADGLRAALSDADDAERARALVIARVWDGYLPIGEGSALARLLAELAEAIGLEREARRFTAAAGLLERGLLTSS